MAVEVLNLFSVPVMVTELEGGLTEQEIAFLEKQEMRRNVGNLMSVDDYILENTELSRLKNWFLEQLDYYKTNIMGADIEMYITQSWTSLNPKGAWFHQHNHVNSIVSGTFYLQANKDSPYFVLHRPKNEFVYNFHPKEYNIFNSQLIKIPVSTNKLILFPSQLEHHVDANQTEMDRISLAFNSFFKGRIGDRDSLNELILE